MEYREGVGGHATDEMGRPADSDKDHQTRRAPIAVPDTVQRNQSTRTEQPAAAYGQGRAVFRAEPLRRRRGYRGRRDEGRVGWMNHRGERTVQSALEFEMEVAFLPQRRTPGGPDPHCGAPVAFDCGLGPGPGTLMLGTDLVAEGTEVGVDAAEGTLEGGNLAEAHTGMVERCAGIQQKREVRQEGVDASHPAEVVARTTGGTSPDRRYAMGPGLKSGARTVAHQLL